MKLVLVGLPNSGKKTIFETLTHSFVSGKKNGGKLSTTQLYDSRINVLETMYKPKKTIYAQVEYFLPGKSNNWEQVKNCDAIVHIIGNFINHNIKKTNLVDDFLSINQELILSDIIVAENRLNRLKLDAQRGKNNNQEESFLLEQCLDILGKEEPLRNSPKLANAKILKGFSFLSAKPMIVLVNNSDENDKIPNCLIFEENFSMVIRGRLEKELSQLEKEDLVEFSKEFNISTSITKQVISASYNLLGLSSFFTVGKDEVRAWTIKTNSTAVEAAKTIHSDIKKGFIRAEVVSYNDLISAGDYNEARRNGFVRLEGKSYIVSDGDIINFRFNI